MTEIPFQNTDPKYDRLVAVLHKAYEQAAVGKGKERHANGLAFEDQPMQTICQLLRSEKGMAYQVIKKLTEGLNLPTHERRVAELLGAIVYLAGIVIYLEDKEAATAKPVEDKELSEEPAQLGPTWRYSAVDENGDFHVFTHKPVFDGAVWRTQAGHRRYVSTGNPMESERAACTLQRLPTEQPPFPVIDFSESEPTYLNWTGKRKIDLNPYELISAGTVLVYNPEKSWLERDTFRQPDTFPRVVAAEAISSPTVEIRNNKAYNVLQPGVRT